MQQLLSKFFVIKSVIYLIGFSVVWYLFVINSPIKLFQKDSAYTIWVNQICFTNNCFDIQIADNDQEREYGLMNRVVLPSQSGMLFVFEQQKIYPFWMKNTKIPLDMIWIDDNNRVVDIQTAQPCLVDPCMSYTPSGSWLYVLEINAWLSSLLWIKKWSIVQFIKK